MGYTDSEDEEYMNSSEEEETKAKVQNTINEPAHLQAAQMYGVQTKIFTPRVQGSLEQLASDPSKATWKLSPELQKLLRQVKTTKNRSKAGEEEFVGDISKAVILECTILQERNDYPVPIAVNIPYMVPQVYDSDIRCNWLIEKETPTTNVNRPLFEPDSLFTQHMYDKLEKLDLESLNNEIRFEKDPKATHALMDPNGFAWKILMKNVYKGNFPGIEHKLIETHEDVARGNGHVFVKVPVEVARDIHAALAEPLKEIEDSFVDMRKLTCTFQRADNQHWNSIQGLLGAHATLDEDSKHQMKATNLENEYSASVKLLIKYIVY